MENFVLLLSRSVKEARAVEAVCTIEFIGSDGFGSNMIGDQNAFHFASAKDEGWKTIVSGGP